MAEMGYAHEARNFLETHSVRFTLQSKAAFKGTYVVGAPGDPEQPVAYEYALSFSPDTHLNVIQYEYNFWNSLFPLDGNFAIVSPTRSSLCGRLRRLRERGVSSRAGRIEAPTFSGEGIDRSIDRHGRAKTESVRARRPMPGTVWRRSAADHAGPVPDVRSAPRIRAPGPKCCPLSAGRRESGHPCSAGGKAVPEESRRARCSGRRAFLSSRCVNSGFLVNRRMCRISGETARQRRVGIERGCYATPGSDPNTPA